MQGVAIEPRCTRRRSFPVVVTPEIADSFGHDARCLTTGVWPRGAQVWTRVGTSWKPLSAAKISVA